MLSELCKELNNWFCTKRYFGTYTIEDGILVIPELQSGQYYRICGSVFNDGVHKYGDAEVTFADFVDDGVARSVYLCNSADDYPVLQK